MTAAEVLRNAARVIRERGWIQGRYVGDKGEVCANQAIMIGAQDPSGRIDWIVVQLAYDAMYDKLSVEHGTGVVGWNDTVTKSADEVCAKLEEVAEELEG